jgi:hypothetical protein
MFIFIRIPKTGSSSMHSVFQSNCDNYEQIKGKSTPYYNEEVSSLRETISKEFSVNKNITFGHIDVNWIVKSNLIPLSYYESSFKFAFVRNPWDRLVSLYRHRIEIIKDTLPDFDTWVREYLGDVPPVGPYNVRGLSQANCQVDWIPKDIDFIGRYERIQDDFNLVCDQIGINRQQLPRILKTKHKPYYKYYDDSLKELIAIKYNNAIVIR